jgi:aminoglycoside phosphotransferase (APT) family kinase protein
LGETLARIHAATANRADIAHRFANGAQFHALRLEPYLLHTAKRHPDVARRIRAISDHVAEARIALMHGDFSPKNILCGPHGPLILDAETACYGDPAFDLAFCLNHFALKCAWHREYVGAYLSAFGAFKDAYFAGMNWETADEMDRRTTPLLAALMLARIDGKSPVEYLTAERDKNFVRLTAKQFLRSSTNLDSLLAAWRAKLEAVI